MAFQPGSIGNPEGKSLGKTQEVMHRALCVQGTYDFKAGQSTIVTISNEDTGGYVIIDCVQWLPKP